MAYSLLTAPPHPMKGMLRPFAMNPAAILGKADIVVVMSAVPETNRGLTSTVLAMTSVTGTSLPMSITS